MSEAILLLVTLISTWGTVGLFALVANHFDKRYSKTPPPGIALNLGVSMLGKKGWVNMDAYNPAPGVVRHDMVNVPWPFPSNHFDLVRASHVLEHIPFVYLQDSNNRWRDVQFLIFEELHRILKPGGILEIETPLAGSDMQHANLQHYRDWTPAKIMAFTRQRGGDQNYYHTAHFNVEYLNTYRSGIRAPYWCLVGKSHLPLLDHVAIRCHGWLDWLLRPRHGLRARLQKPPQEETHGEDES